MLQHFLPIFYKYYEKVNTYFQLIIKPKKTIVLFDQTKLFIMPMKNYLIQYKWPMIGKYID